MEVAGAVWDHWTHGHFLAPTAWLVLALRGATIVTRMCRLSCINSSIRKVLVSHKQTAHVPQWSHVQLSAGCVSPCASLPGCCVREFRKNPGDGHWCCGQ